MSDLINDALIEVKSLCQDPEVAPEEVDECIKDILDETVDLIKKRIVGGE